MSVGDGTETFRHVAYQVATTVTTFTWFDSMVANGDGFTDAYHTYSNAAGIIMTFEIFLFVQFVPPERWLLKQVPTTTALPS